MPGLSDISAKAVLNGITGQPATAWPTTLFLALFTAIGTDAGTGFTEVSGGAYARVQVAGNLAISSGQGATGTTLTFSSVPSWVVANMSITDTTHAYIPANTTIVSTTSTTITLSAATTTAVPTSDNIQISAFTPPTGGEPNTVTNNSVITFAQATASWGTAVAFGLYDASSSGNLWAWDYIGNFSWLPAYITSASPAVVDCKGNGYSANDSIIYSNEYGGTLMTMSAGSFTLTGDGSTGVSPVLTVISPSGDTFNINNGATAINTSTSGSGMIRKIIQQSIPINVTASFAAATLTITGA